MEIREKISEKNVRKSMTDKKVVKYRKESRNICVSIEKRRKYSRFLFQQDAKTW